MTWKETLRQLEYKKDWDTAIEFMQHVIHQNPDDMDAHIYMNFLLMNLLVEEDHSHLSSNKLDYYARLARYYFDISYAKYSENAEYLFYTGITAVMSEWYWGIEIEDYLRMLDMAMQLEPDNILYRWQRIVHLKEKDPINYKELKEYYENVLKEDSYIQKTLRSKGAVGAYLLRLITNSAKDFLNEKHS